jgi:hypothetical protein
VGGRPDLRIKSRDGRKTRISVWDSISTVWGLIMNKSEFGMLLDQTGLTLTDAQKTELFAVYPMLQAMIARATPPMTREAEPAVIFMPEVK